MGANLVGLDLAALVRVGVVREDIIGGVDIDAILVIGASRI